MTETGRKWRVMEGFRKVRLALILLLAGLCGGLLCAMALNRAGETTRSVITSDLLRQQIQSVQELATVEYRYTNMGKFENRKEYYGWVIPFTAKTFIISYDGVIKAGIDIGGVRVDVNEEQKTVTVTLPKCKILSHEIPEDTITVFDESRNLFNPISIRDYTDFTRDQKAVMEAKAIDSGLYDSASERAVLTVTALLEALPGMESYTLQVK